MPAADLVVITLKTTANDQLENLVGPLLKPSTVILTLQNGLGNEERLSELFGASRVLGGVAFVCINRAGPGIIEHTAHGKIHLGEPGGGISARSRRIAEILTSSSVQAKAIEDLKRGRWEKLCWNIPFNGQSWRATDLTTNQLPLASRGPGEHRASCGMSWGMCWQAAAGGVGARSGTHGYRSGQISRTREMGAYRSSSQIDRQQGRPMEVEAIFGKPLAAARDHGVVTP